MRVENISVSVRDRNLHFATTDDIRTQFTDRGQELEWLALFLTGDAELAPTCVKDACALATSQNRVFRDWLERWARRSTITTAIEMQHSEIKQLAEYYEHKSCAHREHPFLTSDELKLLHACADELDFKLDAVCRAALVLRGVERYCLSESALLLGVRKAAVEAAYCSALSAVKALRC